jgi:DNA modification methylase
MPRVPLSQLKPAPWNPRTISDERFKNLCRSIEADPGLLDLRPILARLDGTIYGGNQRFRAVEHLGWQDVPADLSDVSDRLAKERALRDNGSWGEWTDDLTALLNELKAADADLDLLGFPEPDLERLLAEPKVLNEDDADLTPPTEPITKPGDLWLLGQHRLLCGDATKAEDVARLMGDNRAVLFATDPPYLVDYDGLGHPTSRGAPDKNKDWSERYGVHWDESMSADGGLYTEFSAVAKAHAVREDAAWYCWHGFRRQALLESIWTSLGVLVHQQIIWRKNHPILARTLYMWQHESCFYGWVSPNKPPRVSSDTVTSVWDVPSERLPGEQTDHPTMKPVELFAIPMRQHTQLGDVCYEPFSGSGSQLVAAEQLGRKCFALEIDPRFVDVAVRRWEHVTGRKAALDGQGSARIQALA